MRRVFTNLKNSRNSMFFPLVFTFSLPLSSPPPTFFSHLRVSVIFFFGTALLSYHISRRFFFSRCFFSSFFFLEEMPLFVSFSPSFPHRYSAEKFYNDFWYILKFSNSARNHCININKIQHEILISLFQVLGERRRENTRQKKEDIWARYASVKINKISIHIKKADKYKQTPYTQLDEFFLVFLALEWKWIHGTHVQIGPNPNKHKKTTE